ncbi:MAG: hypothetical protein HRF50_12845, partial [Phycisphaerae bacterium]
VAVEIGVRTGKRGVLQHHHVHFARIAVVVSSADLDGDGCVGLADLSALLTSYGT